MIYIDVFLRSFECSSLFLEFARDFLVWPFSVPYGGVNFQGVMKEPEPKRIPQLQRKYKLFFSFCYLASQAQIRRLREPHTRPVASEGVIRPTITHKRKRNYVKQ